MSTKEIAQAAGIAEGTIFRVFESKDDLVLACVHEAFDSAALVAELAQIERTLALTERLSAAVGIMQGHLQGIFALMAVLQSSGQPLHPPSGDREHERRRQATAELDDAFLDLMGADATLLRIPAKTFIGHLRMLTLSSVHPMLDGEHSAPEQVVDVLLEGALDRSATPDSPATPTKKA